MNKRILLYGLGLSSKAALNLALREKVQVYLVSHGRVDDWRPKNISKEWAFSEEDVSSWEKALCNTDTVILSPGIPSSRPLVKKALEKNIDVIGEIDFACRFLKTETVIAVTGTNGKTTTATMLRDMLKAADKHVFLGGNIGNPLSNYVLNKKYCEFIVLELSSFQLETICFLKPHLAIFLNIYNHHGERYKTQQDYLKAKSRLTTNMMLGDYLIHLDTPELSGLYQKKDFHTIKVPLNPSGVKKALSPFDLAKIKILGEHNLINFVFVLQAARTLGIDLKFFGQLLENFQGIEHRFERIESHLGKFVINDSKSTNFSATETALSSLKSYRRKITLILGGQKRGKNDFPSQKFIEEVKKSCCEILVYGEVRFILATSLSSTNMTSFQTLQEALMHLKKGPIREVILFSPAFPSFDQFESYKARGEAFKRFSM